MFHKSFKICTLLLLILFALLYYARGASASTITGGSDLLSNTSLTTLETWLGEGPIDLTNIFDKTVGDTGLEFHAAVGNRGPTFTIIEVLSIDGQQLFSPIIIGGYNPQSWDGSRANWVITAPGNREAFIFNLTGSEVRFQNPTDTRGQYQTFDYSFYGPLFGAGYDIFVDTTLSSGSNYSYSYGTEAGGVSEGWSQGLAGPQSSNCCSQLTYGQIEVFAITAFVPEPSAWLLLGSGLFALGTIRGHRLLQYIGSSCFVHLCTRFVSLRLRK